MFTKCTFGVKYLKPMKELYNIIALLEGTSCFFVDFDDNNKLSVAGKSPWIFGATQKSTEYPPLSY